MFCAEEAAEFIRAEALRVGGSSSPETIDKKDLAQTSRICANSATYQHLFDNALHYFPKQYRTPSSEPITSFPDATLGDAAIDDPVTNFQTCSPELMFNA